MTANQMIWPIAVEAGYFKKYGIDLDLSYINGSSTAVPALINGDIGITTVAGSAVVSAQAGGQDLVMIAGFLNKAVWKVMAGPGITPIDQGRGEAMARWPKDPPFVKDVIKKYLKIEDQQVIDAGYDAYAKIWPQAPYPTEPGLQRVIDQVAATNAKAKDLKPQQMIDRSFVQELESSGFIAQIYK